MKKGNNWNNENTDRLIKAILAIENKKEAKMFLRDLLTERELIEFGNRWKVVNMLNDKISYKKIEKEIGLSSTTIARISNWAQKGSGGYGLMLKKLSNSKKHYHSFLEGKEL